MNHALTWYNFDGLLTVFVIALQASFIFLWDPAGLMHFKHCLLFVLITTLLCLFPAVSVAEVPTPRIKPAPPKLSQYIGSKDARYFQPALTAAERRQWSSVASYRNKISDPTAKDVLIWIAAMRDANVSTQDLTYVIQNLSDWPRMTGIQAKAEYRLFDKPMRANDTIAWFAGREPVSGEGRAALADAYYATGDTVNGDRYLKLAWREAKLTRDRQKRIFSKHKNRLSQDDHAARAEYLMWEGTAHFSKIQGLLSLMSASDRALMDARMRTLSNRSGMDSAIKKVPASMQKDTGLLYARAKWRRRKKTKEYALPVYLDIDAPAPTEKGMDRVWRERKIMAYWAIQERRFNDAYALTQNHGMERGSGFAEAEFLAGWLALQHLRQPDTAINHFQKLRNGVSMPVSVSRAAYWLGRAHEAKSDPSSTMHYADAAQFPNTYYGFLASDRMSPDGRLLSLPPEPDGSFSKAQFEADRRVRAMTLLGEARNERFYTIISFHLDDEFENAEELSLLAKLGKKYGFMRPPVRAAKQASRLQTMLTDSGYPVPEAILNLPDKFDKAFVLAIARQESEFNVSAVSSARAYGMMQMINATAASTARKHRIRYNKSRLTTDVDYSANLGALHLHDLLRQFDGSYILSAAAYNAGPHRAKQWIKAYGDPRSPDVDAIDWLESIPFSETRNYIQRVMENMQVYRARLNGNAAPNRIYSDITNGAF